MKLKELPKVKGNSVSLYCKSWRWKEKKKSQNWKYSENLRWKKAFKHLAFIRRVYQECRKITNLKKKTFNKQLIMWLHGCTYRHMGVWPEEAKDTWRLWDELSHHSFCRWVHSLPHYRGDLSQGLMAEVLVKGARESKYTVSASGRGCHCLHTSWLQAENCSKLYSYRPCQNILNSF